MAKTKMAVVVRDAEEASEHLPALPESAEKADRDLVDRAISHIRDVLSGTVSKGMEEVGQYLLREFYDDDPELYYSASPNKHASLRLLVERCESMDLPVGRTFLANALRMAAVSKGLPRGASFIRLPPSHRVELLRVRSPEIVERLAAKAVGSNLSVQKLRALVRKQEDRGAAKAKRGRRRTPAVLKAIEMCLRALRDEDTGRLLFRRSDIDEMTDEQRARGQAALESLEKRIADLSRLMSD
jgi:hypothetical protein